MTGWVTVAEAREGIWNAQTGAWGVSRQRVHQLIADGRIRAKRLHGRLIVVSRASLRKLAKTAP